MIEAIGERQLAIAFDIESRLLHSIERNPPVLTGFATRPWQAAWFTDLVARDVAKISMLQRHSLLVAENVFTVFKTGPETIVFHCF